MKIEEAVKQIRPLMAAPMEECKDRWNSLAKPIHGLGRLEEVFMQIAGIQGSADVKVGKKALIVMCADNGVVEEGVSQTESSVTKVVADNFAKGHTTACIMAKRAGVDVFPADIGVNEKTEIYDELKVRCGTGNIAKSPAMTREEARKAVEAGIKMACMCKEKGYEILLTGEMGIGNTTTSSAVAAVLLDVSVEQVTGRGAGLSFEGLKKKQAAVKNAIENNRPDRKDPLDVLAKVGGLDIAGLAGVFLGGAACGLPVVIDGFISAVAALLASKFSSLVRSYAIPSHMSKEPAMERVMSRLAMEPYLNCNMGLGEGTGAVALMPLLDMTYDVYTMMDTFEQIEIEPYQPFGCH